jgi:hypothetical protein
MSVTVGLEALGHDSGLWDGVSSTLSAASAAASGLTLSMTSLSWAAGEEGLVDVYEEARARVQRLCTEGATETGVISSTLLQVKAAYESSDTTQKAAYDGMWEPK